MRTTDEVIAQVGKKSILSGETVFSFDTAYRRFKEFIGKTYKPKRPPKRKKKKGKKILSLSDPHIPFHDEEKLVKAVEENKDADICAIPGDFLDLFAASRFTKYKDVEPELEVREGTKVLTWLSETFPEVVMIPGNHDERLRKYFASRIDPRFLPLVQYDLLDLMRVDLPNVSIPKYYVGEEEVRFIIQIGDLILGHAETYSKVDLRACQNFMLWLDQGWGKRLGLKPYRVVGNGHTHQAGVAYMGDGRARFELGCLCKPLDYTLEPNIRYRPQVNAYGVFQQDEKGNTRLNESQLFTDF